MPRGCLDVLAQQVIACVAMEPWDVPALFDLVRCAYPYRDLTAEAFESVLRLVSGRFPSPGLRDLRARVAWDPIHNRLAALPGTAQLALVGGGTIPDTGQFPVYLGDGGPRLGRARRGIRLRAAGRRDVHAGQFDLADRRPSSRIACWSAGPRASRR